MKPVKITVELTFTPEMFKEWCCEDIPESEGMYRHYVEKMVYNYFGFDVDYEDYINATSLKESGLKLTMEELK